MYCLKNTVWRKWGLHGLHPGTGIKPLPLYKNPRSSRLDNKQRCATQVAQTRLKLNSKRYYKRRSASRTFCVYPRLSRRPDIQVRLTLPPTPDMLPQTHESRLRAPVQAMRSSAAVRANPFGFKTSLLVFHMVATPFTASQLLCIPFTRLNTSHGTTRA